MRPSLPAILAALLLAAPAVLPAAVDCSAGPLSRPADRPLIGLVLSGGGARGAAHLGALRVIEEAGIPVDLVVGTSMGSIVGGLYASGMPVDDIDRLVREADWPTVLGDGPPYEELSLERKRELHEFTLGGRLGIGRSGVRLPAGLREGQNIRLMLRGLTQHVNDVTCFRDLAVPYAAVATDAETGETVVLDRGDLVEAMRASMAIPAYFTPVARDGRLLVDGGPANNMPVSLARAMGADVVIAIDIGTPLARRSQLRSLFSISLQMSTMLARRAADQERAGLGPDDVLVVPDLATVATLDFDEMGDAVAAGEAAARTTLATFPWRERQRADARPASRFAARLAAARAPAVLGKVRVEGDVFLPPQQVTDRLGLAAGETLDTAVIDAAITRAYGLDYFATIDYRREPVAAPAADYGHPAPTAAREDTLVLTLRRRDWGPTYLQFGLDLYDDFQGMNRFGLGASFTATELNQLTGQFSLQARIGSNPLLAAELHQPLTRGARLFVAPRAVYERHLIDAYLDGEPLARFRTGRAEAGVDLGISGHDGEWRLGWAGGERRLDLLIGPPAVPAFSSDTGHLRLVAEYDRRDARDFPTRGLRAGLHVEHGSEALGADDDFDLVKLDAVQVVTIGRQHWSLGLRAEALDAGDRILLEPLTLGGPDGMAAFSPGELLGDNVAVLRLAGWRRANQLAWLKLYLGGALEYGGAWNGSPGDHDEAPLETVLSAFAGLSTPIGPVVLVAGVAEEGREAVHFRLGRSF